MLRPIEVLRNTIEGDFFTDAELSNVLGDGPSRHCRTSRLVKEGNILRIKQGLYVFGPLYRREDPNTFHLANLMFGPSYVSFESALSHYGLIPEAVYGVISANTRRSEHYHTPLGDFHYRKLPISAFAAGIKRTDAKPHYLIGTPEKALLDKLYLDSSRDDLAEFCVESLRIEMEDLASLDLIGFQSMAASYGKKRFQKSIGKFVSRVREP